ncbi:excisionase family DNA-binding protein [Rhodococcus hoagii]|jgi:excisionase family DNA binding protein|nr:excisionase family DNA-binding protein [Prescottella equi]
MTAKTPSATAGRTYVSMAEAARMVGVSRHTIRDRIIDGQLPAVRVGTGPRAAVRIRVSDLEALLHPIAAGTAD